MKYGYAIRVVVAALPLFAAPAQAEIHFPAPRDLTGEISSYYHRGAEHEARYLTIHYRALQEYAAKPMEKYAKLEAVMIEFTEDPHAPDDAKEKVIASVEASLAHLAAFRKCPRLKYVVLHAGDFLFIRSAEKFPYGYSGPDTVSAAEGANLQRLNARFGKKIEKLLPGIIVYGLNWGW